mmetsp:Transcript_35181/g.48809  ORF Transcript_35181/g.48809 Transcript_35181/m.48809 type:complete len:204 (+) Transcript_35181:717-1328(+)
MKKQLQVSTQPRENILLFEISSTIFQRMIFKKFVKKMDQWKTKKAVLNRSNVILAACQTLYLTLHLQLWMGGVLLKKKLEDVGGLGRDGRGSMTRTPSLAAWMPGLSQKRSEDDRARMWFLILKPMMKENLRLNIGKPRPREKRSETKNCGHVGRGFLRRKRRRHTSGTLRTETWKRKSYSLRDLNDLKEVSLRDLTSRREWK